MIKLNDLLVEVQQEQLEEGWKENIIAAAIAVAGMFPAKAQQTAAKEKAPMTQTIKQQDSLNVSMGTLFPSGKYIIKDGAELEKVLAQISNYMSKNPNADYKVTITASESKVPNVDAELPNKPEVKPGYLATKRADAAELAIKEFVESIKETGAFKGDVTIARDIKSEQGPDWNPDKGDKSTDSKFTQHQYVNLTVKAFPKDVPDSGDGSYSMMGSKYERIFMGTHSWAAIAYVSNNTKEKYNPGHLDTRYSDVMVRVFDDKKLMKTRRGTLPTYNQTGEEVMNMDIFTGEAYLIPSAVWNNTGRMQMDYVPSSWQVFKVSLPDKVTNNFNVTYSSTQEERDAVVKKYSKQQ